MIRRRRGSGHAWIRRICRTRSRTRSRTRNTPGRWPRSFLVRARAAKNVEGFERDRRTGREVVGNEKRVSDTPVEIALFPCMVGDVKSICHKQVSCVCGIRLRQLILRVVYAQGLLGV